MFKEPVDKFIDDGFNHLLNKVWKMWNRYHFTFSLVWCKSSKGVFSDLVNLCLVLIFAWCPSISDFQTYVICFYFVNSISLKTSSFWTHLLFAFKYYRYGQFYVNLFCSSNHEFFSASSFSNFHGLHHVSLYLHYILYYFTHCPFYFSLNTYILL